MNSSKNTPQEIRTINELITALSEEERTTFSSILRSVNIPLSEFENYASWSDECYTRNCIINNEKFELILLCWEAGQITPVHDHGGEECWVKVIEGEFEETIYRMNDANELTEIKSAVSQKNGITYMIDFMGFHSLKNISDQRSCSLHLYAKPIRSCNSYDDESGELVHRELSYDTVPESIKN